MKFGIELFEIYHSIKESKQEHREKDSLIQVGNWDPFEIRRGWIRSYALLTLFTELNSAQLGCQLLIQTGRIHFDCGAHFT